MKKSSSNLIIGIAIAIIIIAIIIIALSNTGVRTESTENIRAGSETTEIMPSTSSTTNNLATPPESSEGF